MHHDINGILLLDKPSSMTSNQALQRVKRLFHAKKAGHTGSLDPIATGMLPICFGEATKFSQFLLESDKTYHVVAKLGECTTTGDSEGEIIKTRTIDGVTSSQIAHVFKQFLGDIKQIPPMFSAIKYQGKPLYKLARQGIQIDRAPRDITIYALELIDFNAIGVQQTSSHHHQATFTFTVHCSKGTYIRTLVEDIGEVLGCGAHVVELRRMTVTPYHANHMHGLATLENIAKSTGLSSLLTCLLPVETAVRIFPAVTLSAASAFYIRTGQAIRVHLPSDSVFVRLLSEDATFLGIGEVMGDGRIKPKRLVGR
ncbi:MAG: tRNA pseudouridine(55) synthase TruB [Gammaproteobacteria bacterium RIFCSPHIGHO2_12_FULL_37_34]|nr:MAG: tRNA pseudouridine(55) synthase TruB [Gammaproteobacteria bacterium RIFCSPHIGHO2_12_FULL_37_34]